MTGGMRDDARDRMNLVARGWQRLALMLGVLLRIEEKRLKRIFAISIPIIGGMLSQSVINLVDAAMVEAAHEAEIDALLPDTPSWLAVGEDHPTITLPERLAATPPSEAATIRFALGSGASLVLLDGPVKERAKLSFIKSVGTVSILVSAYRQGHLSAVRPMITALEKLGHADVLPPPEQLEALWVALEDMVN